MIKSKNVELSEDEKYDMAFFKENGAAWGVRIPKFNVSEAEIESIIARDIIYYNFNEDPNAPSRGIGVSRNIFGEVVRFDKIGEDIIPIKTTITEAIKIILLSGDFEGIFKCGLMNETRDLIKKDPVINYLAVKYPILMLNLLGEPI